MENKGHCGYIHLMTLVVIPNLVVFGMNRLIWEHPKSTTNTDRVYCTVYTDFTAYTCMYLSKNNYELRKHDLDTTLLGQCLNNLLYCIPNLSLGVC